MKKSIRKNFQTLKDLFDAVIVTDSEGLILSREDALEMLVDKVNDKAKKGGKLFFIGNGGSASIASHMVTDFVKNAEIPAMAFNDPSLITCISNDLGYNRVFEKPLGMLATSKDILIAISSSGQSQNILCGIAEAKIKNAQVITFSGFDEDNPLRKLGALNFYVPSASYSHVEIVHLSLCHSLVDMLVENKGEKTRVSQKC